METRSSGQARLIFQGSRWRQARRWPSKGAGLCRVLFRCSFGVANGLQPVGVCELRMVGRDVVVSLPVMLGRSFMAGGRQPAALGCL
jgi:hypothetical protein